MVLYRQLIAAAVSVKPLELGVPMGRCLTDANQHGCRQQLRRMVADLRRLRVGIERVFRAAHVWIRRWTGGGVAVVDGSGFRGADLGRRVLALARLAVVAR